MSDPIMAATPWPENGDLIADVHRLGYLRDDDHTLDPTYERGIWWKRWRPEKLTTHHRAKNGSDFRDLPHPDGTFDAIAYDPPYVCPGGRKTSTVQNMHDRFGMNEGGAADPDFRTPAELQQLINDGLTEMWRLIRPSAVLTLDPTRPNGVVLVKCKDYIWSGRLSRPGELDEIRFFYPAFAERIDQLEARVADAGLPYTKWGVKRPGRSKDKPSPLCTGCAFRQLSLDEEPAA